MACGVLKFQPEKSKNLPVISLVHPYLLFCSFLNVIQPSLFTLCNVCMRYLKQNFFKFLIHIALCPFLPYFPHVHKMQFWKKSQLPVFHPTWNNFKKTQQIQKWFTDEQRNPWGLFENTKAQLSAERNGEVQRYWYRKRKPDIFLS